MGRDIRLLLVDDDAEFRHAATESLESANDRLRVDTASSPDDARSRLRDEAYDCVVSGHAAPGTDGLAFLEDLRERDPDLPFVLLVDRDDESLREEAVSAGVTDYYRRDHVRSTWGLLADRIDDAVTAREATTAVSQQRHRLEQILKTVPSCVVQLDSDGRFVFANQRAEQVLGLEREAVTDRTYNDPEWRIRDLEGDEIPDEKLPFRRVVDTGEPIFDFVHKIQWPEGDERVLSVSGAPLFDGESVDSVVFSLTDITDRRYREDRLIRLHEASRDLYDADTTEEIADITSQAAAEILDFELNGVHLYDEEAGGLAPVAVSERTEQVADSLVTFDQGIAWEVYESGTVRSYADIREAPELYDPETDMRSGLYFPLGRHGVLLANSKQPDDFGETDLWLGRLLAANATTAFDRIERESLLRSRTNALAAQNRRLDEFASVVAHDLRSPLHKADSLLELWRQTGDESHVDEASDTLSKMETLIDDLLSFARQDTTERKTEPVSVREAAERTWKTLSADAAALSIDGDRQIVAAPSRLNRILANLFDNSVRHGGEGVTITVGFLEDGFYVADDGPGIPPDERTAVFETGYSSTDDGTGFGLAIVRRAVDAHDWEVTITESDAGGSRFEITGVESGE
ncbi:hybrid sensor histidine kinase/response regulator [Haloarcula sp. GH36]|uniref:hybrid sensor histidine kinase/response regulator n=1 Tax=Haloarcula montana TaxID=3111776 RepID=UPI002D777EF4|nr:ATP-binding protein [Haloarcula sp. GH36]